MWFSIGFLLAEYPGVIGDYFSMYVENRLVAFEFDGA
jgi:hypothetical protein